MTAAPRIWNAHDGIALAPPDSPGLGDPGAVQADAAAVLHRRDLHGGAAVYLRAARPRVSDAVRMIRKAQRDGGEPPTAVLEIAQESTWATITVVGMPTGPAQTARIFRAVADLGISPDMIARSDSAHGASRCDILFAMPGADTGRVLSTLGRARDTIEFDSLRHDGQIGKVSLIGTGLQSRPSCAATFFAVLSAAGVGVRLSSLSASCFSVICDRAHAAPAVEALSCAYRPRP